MKKPSRKMSPQGPRSQRRRKPAGSAGSAEGVQAPQHRDIDLPKIFVRVPPARGHYGYHDAQARIVLRRKVYRYLVWKEHGRKRMLYLGKIKIRALLARSIAPAASAADIARRGGQE